MPIRRLLLYGQQPGGQEDYGVNLGSLNLRGSTGSISEFRRAVTRSDQTL
ncbi:hypothetical protein ACIPW4_13345 [Pseudomonas sp. NPDC089996]